MARKASLISNFGLVQKTKWPPYHMFNIKQGYPTKKAYISSTIAPIGLECENNL